MRSGELIATNDVYIEELIKNPDYDIRENGEIWTLITETGKRSASGVWRQTGLNRRSRYEGYLSLKYKRKTIQVHRVIYRKFKGPLEPDLVINHIDGNPSNNHPSNLEMVTQSWNMVHVFRDMREEEYPGQDLNLQALASTGT